MGYFIEVTNSYHGGGANDVWGLGNALWSPERGQTGNDTWSTMRSVQQGDIIIHSVKINGSNHVIYGKSVASSRCEVTPNKPNDPGSWVADSYYRVPLDSFEEFDPKYSTAEFLLANRKKLSDQTQGKFYTKHYQVAQKYLSKLTEDEYSLIMDYVQNGGNQVINQGGNYVSTIDRIEEELLNNNIKQLILTGAPGTGKTYAAKQFVERQLGNDYVNSPQYGFVQFHPSYDYTDFVEGIRPIEQNGEVRFVKTDGIFKEFCRKAAEDEFENKYFFVIDEVNRADLSKVFGELMYSLDTDYRGPENKIKTQYHNMRTFNQGNDIFSDGFYIPRNVFIIGTMNDIDRSVESFDFALRRRFRWINIKANSVVEEILNSMWNDPVFPGILERIINLNDVISGEIGRKLGIDENYHIGPAYFKDPGGLDFDQYLRYIWDTRIEPLLKEYVRGRRSDFVTEFISACHGSLLEE